MTQPILSPFAHAESALKIIDDLLDTQPDLELMKLYTEREWRDIFEAAGAPYSEGAVGLGMGELEGRSNVGKARVG